MKTVTLDTLTLEGANVWVDLASGQVRVEAGYTLSSAAEGVVVHRRREVQDLLSAADREAILGITARLKSALEAQEL